MTINSKALEQRFKNDKITAGPKIHVRSKDTGDIEVSIDNSSYVSIERILEGYMRVIAYE